MSSSREGDANQCLSEIGVDAPVRGLLGISQGRARDVSSEPKVIKLLRYGTQTGLYVAKVLTKS
jgi:hypothetical protein